MGAVTALAATPAWAGDAPAQPAPVTSHYLALGDSLALGVQPDATGEIHPTDAGYPDLLATRLRAMEPGLSLTKLGCSGETTTTFLVGGVCGYDGLGSQLFAALAFLLRHRGEVRLVTINLGGNDIGGCADATGIDLSCVDTAKTTIGRNLTTAMAALRLAAGPGVPIVGMNFYDPFLAFWLFGPAGQQIADGSLVVTADVNRLVEEVYHNAGAAVADVETAFQTFVTTPVTLPGIGEVPLNVARICQLLWMCAPPPVGPNTHPNDDGYRVIAEAFEAQVH